MLHQVYNSNLYVAPIGQGGAYLADKQAQRSMYTLHTLLQAAIHKNQGAEALQGSTRQRVS